MHIRFWSPNTMHEIQTHEQAASAHHSSIFYSLYNFVLHAAFAEFTHNILQIPELKEKWNTILEFFIFSAQNNLIHNLIL